jgi:two-component system, chemotaxis family, chemotaxis protein CheY
MKILIAEDDNNCRMILKKFVEPFGQVEEAADGEEALYKFNQALSTGSPFNLIFLDIMMPKYNGLEVIEKIRDHEISLGLLGESSATVVMTTALDDEEKIFDAHVSGCFNYLTKPLSRALVVEQVKLAESLKE